VSHVQRKLKKC